MKVKICGITNLLDAQYAISQGADALGFVFYEKSPRYISPLEAKTIIDQLPPFVEKVGLFVEKSSMDIESISRASHITLAQIHFDIDEKFLAEIDFPTLPVLRLKAPEDIDKFSDKYRLVDVHSSKYGGSGDRLDLKWFQDIDCSKIILAGGLTVHNVKQASEYGFYGVDVSTGVEQSKGVKNPDKVKEFIANAKSI